jgi:hypothetical protein
MSGIVLLGLTAGLLGLFLAVDRLAKIISAWIVRRFSRGGDYGKV